MKPFTVTEDQRTTLTNALEVAAERFKRNAADLRTGDYRSMGGRPIDQPNAYVRIAEQFDRQAIEAQALASVISDAYEITVTPYDEAIHGDTVHCSECGADVPVAGPEDRTAGVMCLECAG